jgi:hypothetical protein
MMDDMNDNLVDDDGSPSDHQHKYFPMATMMACLFSLILMVMAPTIMMLILVAV